MAAPVCVAVFFVSELRLRSDWNTLLWPREKSNGRSIQCFLKLLHGCSVHHVSSPYANKASSVVTPTAGGSGSQMATSRHFTARP